jgi:hypothetical protein
MVDDKLRIVTAMKRIWGDRLMTVFVRHGYCALDPKNTATIRLLTSWLIPSAIWSRTTRLHFSMPPDNLAHQDMDTTASKEHSDENEKA